MRPRHHRGDDHRDRARPDLVGREGSGGAPAADQSTFARHAGRPRARRAPIATHHGDAVRVDVVAFRNVPSFVFEAVAAGAGRRRARSPSTSPSAAPSTPSSTPRRRACRSTPAHLPELRALGMTIAREVERLRHVVHPLDAGLKGIYGTIFTAPAQQPDAHLRNVTIFADAEVDRSPCGTGTAAVMAVLSEMGVLLDDAPFVHESIVGTTFSGRVVERARGRRPGGDRPRDRRLGLDHRRAHVPDRRRRSAEGRVPALTQHVDPAAKAGGYGCLLQRRNRFRESIADANSCTSLVSARSSALDGHQEALADDDVQLAALAAWLPLLEAGLPPTVVDFS